MFIATDHTAGSDIKRLGAWGREGGVRTTRTQPLGGGKKRDPGNQVDEIYEDHENHENQEDHAAFSVFISHVIKTKYRNHSINEVKNPGYDR